MNKKIILGLSALMVVGLASCGGKKPSTSSKATSTGGDTTSSVNPVDDTSTKTTLRMAVNYQSGIGMKFENTSKVKITFPYKAPDGTEYSEGQFKPVFKYLQSNLNFDINDVTPAKNSADYFKTDFTNAKFTGVDVLNGNVSDIVNQSVQGDFFVNLADYLDYMPNLKAFLDKYPFVRTNITTQKYHDETEDAIYYAPYFDGYDDLEKMTLLRADYVKKILDDENTTYDEGVILNSQYTAKVTNHGAVEVAKDMTSLDKVTITRKGSTPNIITTQNALAEKNGKNLIKALRDYIDDAYGTQYQKRSDLFLGVNASYDADEMVALMRCVKTSPALLTGKAETEMFPFIPREYNNQRVADMYRWASYMWPAHGFESRAEYFFFDKDGTLQDARNQQKTVELISNLHDLYSEGLILPQFESKENGACKDGKYNNTYIVGNGGGFMEYDYAQTQGALNASAGSLAVPGYDFRPVLNPVADWDENGKLYQYTESWRSVKTQGWVITKDCAAQGEAQLYRALKLFDYCYSPEGHNLLSYGPSQEKYTDGTIDYNGVQIPKISEGDNSFADQLDKMASGNYTNYLRFVVGGTLPIGYIKEQGMEFQVTNENAKAGLNIVNHALQVGTFKHAECKNVSELDNKSYALSPSSYRLSAGAATELSNFKTTIGLYNTTGSTNAYNPWDKYVMYGFGGTYGTGADAKTLETKEQYLTLMNDTYNFGKFIKAYRDAYILMAA